MTRLSDYIALQQGLGEAPADGQDYARNGTAQDWVVALTLAAADARYSLLSHNHDAAYAPLSHTHTGTYAPLSHTHSEYLEDAASDGDTYGRLNGAWVVLDTGSSGVPAILSNGTTPSLNTNITALEIRTLISAAEAAHTHGTYDRSSSDLSGASVFDRISVTDGIVTSIGTRTLTASSLGAAEDDHTHGTFDWPTKLTGALVFDEVDVTNGIVTNVSSRTLTAADISAAAAVHAHSEYAALTGATFTGDVNATGFNVTSARDKKTQVPDRFANNVWAVHPMKFYYNDDETKKVRMGFFADEVAPYYPEAVTFDDEGEPETVDYAMLVVPLWREVQKLRQLLTDNGIT